MLLLSMCTGPTAQQQPPQLGFVNPFGRAAQDGLFGVMDAGHARTDSLTMRASSTGSGLERFYSALSTQPSWAGGGQQPAGTGWSPHAGTEWPSGGPFGVSQLDLPQMPMPAPQQEVRRSALLYIVSPVQPSLCVQVRCSVDRHDLSARDRILRCPSQHLCRHPLSPDGISAWPQLYLLARAKCLECPQVPAAALMAAVAIASEPGRNSRASAEPEILPDDLDLHALMNTLMCR